MNMPLLAVTLGLVLVALFLLPSGGWSGGGIALALLLCLGAALSTGFRSRG